MVHLQPKAQVISFIASVPVHCLSFTFYFIGVVLIYLFYRKHFLRNSQTFGEISAVQWGESWRNLKTPNVVSSLIRIEIDQP